MSAWPVPRAAGVAWQMGKLTGCQAEGTVGCWHLEATVSQVDHGPHCAGILWADGGWPGESQPAGPSPPYAAPWPQVEDAISQTSQTLQLLIEHDPVSQRLDQLRLDARLSPHLQNAGHSHTLSTLDTKENLEGTLRRRSLRCPRPSPWFCVTPGLSLR